MFPPIVQPSLEAHADNSHVRQLYPDDIFPGGAYVDLPMGRTRYWVFGPQTGTPVVLIHGLSIPAITWKDIAPSLAAKGFRILAYDLYGKGYSEAPQVTYEPVLFVHQLALLLQYLRWNQAHIVGFSMGGGIASAFASSLPHLVAGKVVLIASAGVPPPMDLVQIQVKPTSHPNPIPVMHLIRDVQTQYHAGYKVALESTVQHGPLRGLINCFEKLGKTEQQVLIIHGTEDQIVKYNPTVPTIRENIPHAKLLGLEGAGHDLLVTQPFVEQVIRALVDFLSIE